MTGWNTTRPINPENPDKRRPNGCSVRLHQPGATPGLGVWDNSQKVGHDVANFVAYRNAQNVSHGAYVTAYRYRDAVTFDGPWVQHALASVADYPHTVEDVMVGGDLVLARHNIASSVPNVYRNVRVDGSVVVRECSGDPGVFEFRSDTPATDLQRSDFVVECLLSTISVHNSDGSTFVLSP
jgi:hypothetical protein